MRYIDCEVNDEYVIGSGVVIGAAGSHNDVGLRLKFGDMWVGLNIYATFTDANGEGSAVVMLMPSMLDDGEEMTYLLPIPAEAKKYPGKAMLTLSGFSVINGTQVDKATNTVTAFFRVLKSNYRLLTDSSVTQTLAQQLHSEVNSLGERIEEAETDIADIREDMADIEDKIDNIDFKESDPTVPAWAKQPNKPTYSKSEVELGKVDNVRQYSASNPPPYPVTSVNGQSGAVSLDASDVGAMPAGTKIPAKTSDITNDSGFITKAVSDLANYYTKSQTFTRDEINAKISAIPKFAISVVSSLPTSNISETTVYLVKSGEGGDLYTEYIRVNGSWEILGAQTVDLTGYATETWVNTQLAAYIKQSELDAAIESALASIPDWAKSSEKPSYNANEVGAVAYTAQNLTDAQKAQARANIGALDKSQLPTITQEAGESESLVMSQKAVTDLVAEAIGSGGGGTSTEYETVDSVDEMTDTSKSYVLKSTGTIWAYRSETSVQNVPDFTNLIKFDADGNPANVTLNKRLNSSGATSSQDGSFVIDDYIPANGASIDKIYINRKPALQSKATHYTNTSGTMGGDGNVTIASGDWKQEGDYYVANAFPIVIDSGTYFKFSSQILSTVLTNDDLKGLIVTHDEPIAYTEKEITVSEWYDTGLTPSSSGGGNYVGLLVKVNQNKTDITEVSNRVTALETGSDSITIPTFWQSAVDACIAKIKALQVGRNCVTFPFFSDNHQRNGYAGMLIAHIMKECHIPFCFYGGDSISSGTIANETEMIAQDKAFDTIMSYVPNGRLCRAVGNHDGYWYDGTNKYYYDRNQVYELFLREESIAQNKHFGDDGTYYYIDDIASKVRWVVLNTNGGSVDSTQISWLQNAALSFSESGWAVVFISHQPISNHYHALISNAAEVRTIIKNYINGSATNKAAVVGWFSGHIHRDRIYTGIATNTSDDTEGEAMGFTQVTITSDHTSIAYDDATKHTVANDDQSHAIDFVTINKATRTVNITRLGIGNDRSYSY